MSWLKPSIQLRILVSFTLVTAIGGLVLFLIARRQLENTTLQLYQLNLESEALTLSTSLLNYLGEDEDDGSYDPVAIGNLLKQLRPDKDSELILFAPQLDVMAYTAAKAPSKSLSPSPEITAAQNGRIGYNIRPDITGQLSAFVAAPVSYEQKKLRAIIQIKTPLQRAYDVVQTESIQLASVWLPIVVLTAIISLWIGQGIVHPIRELHGSALRIAGGALTERIQVKSADEIGQLAQAFNYMVERLNLLLTAQRNFVSNAAHELRAPLMGLSLRMEALQEPRLPADQYQTYLRESADELKYMSEMVTSLLTLARLDEGKYRVSIETFDTTALLNDIARNWRIRTQQASLSWTATIPDSLPLPKINSNDLRMVLDNLLSNAVKYSGNGDEIRFEVVCESGKLRFDISDTGVGFDPNEAERLFERFYRTEQARTRSVMGTGLGLAIVRLVLEQYDATVSAYSKGKGQGATFVVHIPLA